jgi:hypothetical protein
VPADEWFAIDVHSSAEAAHPVAAARSVKVASPSDFADLRHRADRPLSSRPTPWPGAYTAMSWARPLSLTKLSPAVGRGHQMLGSPHYCQRHSTELILYTDWAESGSQSAKARAPLFEAIGSS